MRRLPLQDAAVGSKYRRFTFETLVRIDPTHQNKFITHKIVLTKWTQVARVTCINNNIIINYNSRIVLINYNQ